MLFLSSCAALLDSTFITVYAAAVRGRYAAVLGGSMSETPCIWSKTPIMRQYHGCSYGGHVAASDEGPALRPHRIISAVRLGISRRQRHLPDRDAWLVLPRCR